MRLLSATVAATLGVTLALLGGNVLGASAARQLILLGATRSTPAPSCPGNPCQAVGKVTGFQTAASGRKNLFKAPRKGRIVQWTIRLSKPTTSGDPNQTAFFNNFYGTPPKARIAILRRTNPQSTRKPKFKLIRQSPTEELTDYLAQGIVTFVLAAPLKVKKNDVVALSIPTWAPAFAVEISRGNTWRAGRPSKRCNGASNIQAGSAHQSLKKIRTYGCSYRSARLLYLAGLDPS